MTKTTFDEQPHPRDHLALARPQLHYNASSSFSAARRQGRCDNPAALCEAHVALLCTDYDPQEAKRLSHVCVA